MKLEPDPTIVIAPGTPSRPTPSHFASMLVWAEASKRKEREFDFDASEVKRLLKRTFPTLKKEDFVWERLVEMIRLQCRLPFPHDRARAVGSARVWVDSTEYLGEFTIHEDWSRVQLKVVPLEKEPN